jgi:malonate decarboxylase epsilon subunit
MNVALIFPAQGSHYPGMLNHLLDHPAVFRTLDEISAELDFDVRDLDSEQSLQSDVSVQLALFAPGIATARALMEQDIRPELCPDSRSARLALLQPLEFFRCVMQLS